VRYRAIIKALYHGIVPWWVYEKEKHFEGGYLRHLGINLSYAWRWLTFREFESDVDFEITKKGLILV
jgi:hypothetical protein